MKESFNDTSEFQSLKHLYLASRTIFAVSDAKGTMIGTGQSFREPADATESKY